MTIYYAVDKSNDKVVGVMVERYSGFPAKGNDASLVILEESEDFYHVVDVLNVFFSSAKKYEDMVQFIPSNMVKTFSREFHFLEDPDLVFDYCLTKLSIEDNYE